MRFFTLAQCAAITANVFNKTTGNNIFMPPLKLFMLLIGCKPPGRHTEQHDVFFGIAASLQELAPQIEAFWPEPEKLHIDAWREVNVVDGYRVSILSKSEADSSDHEQKHKLFFINLGGYQENKFEEQHYVVLTVKTDRSSAFKEAKQTLFFQHNHFPGAESHIDDKYGIDVDDLYQVEEILLPSQKEQYQIELAPAEDLKEDHIYLGYLKLSRLKQGILTTE
jgi:hypothetical protein